MEKRDLEIIQKYISSDAELKRCMDEHEGYERKLAEFNRPSVSQSGGRTGTEKNSKAETRWPGPH